MPKTPPLPPLPGVSAPSRLVPGKSREQVARALKISADEVGQIERLALAKCFAEMTRRGLSIRDFLPLINLPNEHQYHVPSHPDQD